MSTANDVTAEVPGRLVPVGLQSSASLISRCSASSQRLDILVGLHPLPCRSCPAGLQQWWWTRRSWPPMGPLPMGSRPLLTQASLQPRWGWTDCCAQQLQTQTAGSMFECQGSCHVLSCCAVKEPTHASCGRSPTRLSQWFCLATNL
jgi:hypothetical protein